MNVKMTNIAFSNTCYHNWKSHPADRSRSKIILAINAKVSENIYSPEVRIVVTLPFWITQKLSSATKDMIYDEMAWILKAAWPIFPLESISLAKVKPTRILHISNVLIYQQSELNLFICPRKSIFKVKIHICQYNGRKRGNISKYK